MMWPDLGKCIEMMKLIDKVTETKYLPYPSRSRRIKNKRRNKRKKWKMMGKLKIKQIELKDVDITTLNEGEVYYCELNNFYIQDLYYEHISTLLENIREKSDVVLFKVENWKESERWWLIHYLHALK